ncbi:MAG: 16S rRNA (cytidine(1402)-2'-O)-methyltransferase [Geobacteraceae bacterium]|nr:16S rRNA (cytidine(1402)-2'-O)-methyltransferase [Geobacteraceae bacterium]
MKTGTLYIIATPIGNLEDITLRALRILREVDLIAAEDTRHSRKLLSHFGISKPLTSYFDHNKNIKGALILEKLREGMSVALISDAGTPCISDPGYQLIRDAWSSGVNVVPLPGPCAAMTALSASGLPVNSFVFEGFLPNRSGKRREKLLRLKDEVRVLIFYEAPVRILATLLDVMEILGDRDAVLAREVTKIHEEFLRGKVSEILDTMEARMIKGEIVLMIAPSPPDEKRNGDMVEILLSRYILEEGMSVKDAVKRVVQESGEAKSGVYRQALKLVE